MLAATLAVTVAFAPQKAAMLKMNPVAEGAPAHGLYEVIVLLMVLSIVDATCVIAYKRWPMFLHVHRDISLAAVL